MRARIGDVVIDKTYHKNGRLAIVVGEGISQPILLHHRSGITMDKLGDCFSTWEGLEVIGHIDFEKLWAEAVRTADRKTENSSEKPNNCEPQTDCRTCKHNTVRHTFDLTCEGCIKGDKYEPQTDCPWK